MRGQLRAPSIATLLCLLLLGTGCLATITHFDDFQFEFEWKTSEWSRCERLHHPMCCSVCVQTRKVTCLHTLKNITVPRHFCLHSNGLQGNIRPNEIRECEECEQDCVVSTWSSWSPCDETVQRQYRTRQVLVLPSSDGAQCGATIDTRRCPRNKACDGCDRRYRWKVGKWSNCEETDSSVSGMGTRSRSVECTNRRGSVVKTRRCLKARGMLHSAPLETEMCRISQDCEVSEWSEWSECNVDCVHDRGEPGVQSRTRQVVKWPQNSGLVCPLLLETSPCQNTTLPRCSSYSWYTSFWSACTVLPNTDLTSLSDDVTSSSGNVTAAMKSGDVLCGPGWQQRTVYCTLDSEKTKTPVNQLKCIQDDPLSLAPPTRRPCEVPCPEDCQLGEWRSWSSCSLSCGAGHVSTRSRPVLAKAMFGGEECGLLSETKPCKYTECNWWYKAAWSACLPDGGETCGPGLKTRFVYCQSIDDRQLNDHECQADKPNKTSPCTVPCETCRVAEWTAWTACSQTCGPKPGSRTRARRLLPDNPGGDCANLEVSEWQPCGQTICWSFSWRVGIWGECGRNATTGLFEQSRQIVCVDDTMPERPIPEQQCQATPRPAASQSCVPVQSRDCIMTAWSDWTACSVTCGNDGRQARRRQVLVRERYGKACPPHDEQGLVFEYRACVRLKQCPEYKWSVDSSWSQCTTTAERECGTGIVTRTVHCKYDGKIVDNGMCARHDGKPPAWVRLCYLRCPGDCSLSPWSEFGPCSQTCGTRPGFMVRRRYLLAQRHTGQEGAGTVIHDSAETDYSEPPIIPSSYLLPPRPAHSQPRRAPPPRRRVWRDHASYILDQAAQQFGRSSLYRRKRTLDVRRHWNNGRRVYGYPLPKLRRDYRRSDAYYNSPEYRDYDDGRSAAVSRGAYNYLQSYVDYQPAYRGGVYYRDSPRLAPVLEDPSVDAAFRCPHLTDADLVERVPCGQERCPNYSWEVGEWGSCILTNGTSICGGGAQFRSIQCRREGAVYAHRNQCLHQLHARPLGHKACNVTCSRDCQVSKWSDWTPCSEICGQGTRQRYRGVLVPSSVGGRPCPRLDEVEVCRIRPCVELQWRATEWSACKPDYNLTCGPGTQTRQVYCPAGDALAAECERRSQRPPSQRVCEVACRGNCVMSEWADYFPCNCETSVQYRHRTVTTNPAPGGYECGPLTESRRCRCPQFTLRVGNWTDCKPGLSVWQHDLQRRSLTCRQDGRYPVPLQLCGRHTIQTTRRCQLPENRDCVVGEFGPWSQCGECGAHLIKQRHRPILQAPSGHGKMCPAKHILTQNTTCGLDPCNMYNYHWYVGAWSECKVEGNGCGFGEQHRLVQCRRNDGVLVKQERCFLQDLQTGKAPVRYNTSQQCGSPCPKDCQMSAWSSFGPCYRNCSLAVGSAGYRVRTRSVVKAAGRNGAPCPITLIEIKPCAPMEAVCPSFQWHVNDWSSEKRDVYCVSQGGMKVEGGCIDSLRPLVTWSCTDGATCSMYATCNQATRQCTCKEGYEGDGRECFPLRGCSEDSHCPINSTRCDLSRLVTKGRCICEDGTEPYKGLTCDRRWLEDATMKKDGPLQPDTHIWIIVGACVFVLLAIIVLAAILLRRRPSSSGMLGLNHISNNLSDIPKKVSNEYVNIKGADKDRSRHAGTSHESPTASNPHYIYMNSEFKVQPRMGISSSNFHLAVNTDELDDDVFTDDSDNVFLDPNHVYDDDVFLDTPENLRRKKLSSFQQKPKRESHGSGSRHESHGSHSSTSTVPPACYLQRKRLSTDSSGRSIGPRSGRLGSSSTPGCIVVRDKPSSASSSSESLKLSPPSPPDYTPPPPPPPRPNMRCSPKLNFDFDCPQSPKPELPPRSRPPLSIRRVATPVSMPSQARPPVQAPRSRSSQDLRLPTGTLLCEKSSSESEPEENAPLRPVSRDSEGSDTYLHLCEATWPT